MKLITTTTEKLTSNDIPNGNYSVISESNTFTPSISIKTEYKDDPLPAAAKISVRTQPEATPQIIRIEMNIAELERRTAIAELNRKQSSR